MIQSEDGNSYLHLVRPNGRMRRVGCWGYAGVLYASDADSAGHVGEFQGQERSSACMIGSLSFLNLIIWISDTPFPCWNFYRHSSEKTDSIRKGSAPGTRDHMGV